MSYSRNNMKGFTFVEILIVILVLCFLFALFLHIPSSASSRRSHAQIISCSNKLSQIGKALIQYESPSYYNNAPDININTQNNIRSGARLFLLYQSELADNAELFHCPLNNLPEKFISSATQVDMVHLSNAYKCTDYGLVNDYSVNDPANKIIIADSPFSESIVKYSIHEKNGTYMVGPCVLYKDGHAKNEKSIAPAGSTLEKNILNATIYDAKGGLAQIDVCGSGLNNNSPVEFKKVGFDDYIRKSKHYGIFLAGILGFSFIIFVRLR